MVAQRDAFRKAYEVLEAATKEAYRELQEPGDLLEQLDRVGPDAIIDVQQKTFESAIDVERVRRRLLAAWREAEAEADKSGRPKRRRGGA